MTEERTARRAAGPEPGEGAGETDDEPVVEGDVVDDATAGLAPFDTEVPAGSDADASTPPERGLVRHDPLDAFMARARRYPPLRDDEERALARRARDEGDVDAARRLVLHNLKLVVAIAYEFRRAWADVLDLVQEGSIGLVEATRRWDPDRGARFGTYAAYWIRAYVLRFLITNFRLVHVGNSRAGRKLFFSLERERQKLLASGIDPTAERLGARLGVEPAEVAAVDAHLAAPELALDAPSGPESPAPAERVAAPTAHPEREAGRHEVAGAVEDLARTFAATLTDPRERALWERHLTADDPRPLAELATEFGVTKQRMGQLANGLRTRFRTLLQERFGPDVQLAWLVDAD